LTVITLPTFSHYTTGMANHTHTHKITWYTRQVAHQNVEAFLFHTGRPIFS